MTSSNGHSGSIAAVQAARQDSTASTASFAGLPCTVYSAIASPVLKLGHDSASKPPPAPDINLSTRMLAASSLIEHYRFCYDATSHLGRDAAFAKPPPAPDINLSLVELYRFRYVATSNLGRAAASKKPSPAPDIISVAIPGTHLRRSPPRVRPKAIPRAYGLPVAQRGYAIVVRRSLHRLFLGRTVVHAARNS
jgi:hypothetical protein